MSLLFTLAMLAAEPAVTCRIGSEDKGDALSDQNLFNSGAGLWIAGQAFQPADIRNAELAFSEYDQQPIIRLVFSAEGQKKFLTVQQGRVGKELPIYVDGIMLTCPILLEMIEGGEVQISGGFSADEAAVLAAKIKPRRR